MKKIIKKSVEEEFIGNILQFVAKEGLTIYNIEECMEKVYKHMRANAFLDKDYQADVGSLIEY
ncbi:hypothetical protein [Bacillus licheniformis]|uniref:hypothetical protein n=1 Tax=Bacillus licheniformis TaxID=1402 RepID=UPI00092914F2|nr:hypothetical protein [Bacillus licheniformis]OJT67166.1 hypothetical protein BFP46_21825 [Bacillus licheniformis]